MVKKVLAKVYPHEAVYEDKIRELFNTALKNEEMTGIVLVNSDDIPKGYILGFINELYFHPVQYATCLSIWVEEDCRGHSFSMLDAYEKWARYKGVDSIIISEFTGITPVGLEKIFKRLGFYLKEKQYWKDI